MLNSLSWIICIMSLSERFVLNFQTQSPGTATHMWKKAATSSLCNDHESSRLPFSSTLLFISYSSTPGGRWRVLGHIHWVIPIFNLLFCFAWWRYKNVFEVTWQKDSSPTEPPQMQMNSSWHPSNTLFHGPTLVSPQNSISQLVQPFLQGSQTWPTDRHTDKQTTLFYL